ncbi:peptide ABC transporter substrate-binding protein [Philodulcilactobacillus myokoensis]|uniref:Peptide ABC transporter substrate-binding protein n=1 Tax=Philodulcilactobacillus myokoensis TaxID=2929573 RepID=A0A9W6B0W2_9LACO|nr:ABC transporter substrate-binding protein [Philodulcilactobacillus myokoensis]GLB46501.1 peptide ABC transporter substrate-binding protein [Philodulcilactobacillus myokoensis]
MNKYRKWLTAGVVMLSTGLFAACSNSNSSQVKSGYKPSVKLSQTYHNPNETNSTYNNGTLKLGEFYNSPFAGITDPALTSMEEDTDMFSPGGGDQLFFVNNKDEVVNGGLANLKLDKKAKTATVTVRNNAKWSNGMPVTAKDVEYAYEVLANKDSKTQQYDSDMESIKGLAAYHTGKAKTISGITMPNGPKGKVTVLHFSNFAPSLKYAGNSVMWDAVEPYEYEKNVPIGQLSSSKQVRKDPIFTGPYKMSKMVDGESTSWVPNQYYFGKKAQIKHINIQVVSGDNFYSSLKAKKFDFPVSDVTNPASEFPNVKNLSDYKVVGNLGTSYDYFGFNLGHLNPKNQTNVMDPHMKMGNVKLRQAMMYALDIGTLRKKFDYGLGWFPNTLISPYYKQYYNSKTPYYNYNMKKANQLLDQAGYNKHGKWRTQPNGKPLTINFAGPQGNASTNAQYEYYLQQWRKLGLNAQFTSGKPLEFNKQYSILEKPKQNQIDVWQGAFSVSAEPTPTGEYGASATFNMGHFATKRNTQLLNNMNNSKAWNNNYRTKQFKDWQTYMANQAAYVPTSMEMNWNPVNQRVKGYSLATDNNEFWSNLALTASNPK